MNYYRRMNYSGFIRMEYLFAVVFVGLGAGNGLEALCSTTIRTSIVGFAARSPLQDDDVDFLFDRKSLHYVL